MNDRSGSGGGTGADREPRLAFAPDAWRDLVLYSTLCPFEIGGLGSLRQVGDDFEVEAIHLVLQDVNDITTRLDGDDVSRLIEGMVDRGEDPGKLRLWWHSHAREKTFWSGEDEQTISAFRNDSMLSIVVNHQQLALARLDHYAPRTTTWVWVDRPAEPVEATQAETDAVRARIADVVRYVPDVRRERVV